MSDATMQTQRSNAMKTFAELSQFIRDAADPDDGIEQAEAQRALEGAFADATVTKAQVEMLRSDLAAAYAARVDRLVRR